MKKKLLVVTFAIMMLGLMCGCGATEDEGTRSRVTSEEVEATETNTDEVLVDDDYAGAYLDYDNNEKNLIIKANEDGTYEVEIGIYRLTILEDGVGTLTEEGLEFTATDASGNPIKGVIILEGEDVVVTFTDSTWEYIEDGTSYRYHG